jgi:hypothetical protein
MLNKSFALLLILGIFAGCHKNDSARVACAPMSCTMELRSVIVKFVDKQGAPVVVNNFEAKNTRTKVKLSYSGPTDAALNPGYYVVASDSNLKELAEDGDEILVSGRHPNTGQTLSFVVKVAGGCQCHISKISGPEQVQFD